MSGSGDRDSERTAVMRKDQLHDLLDDDHLGHTMPIAASQLEKLLADNEAAAPASTEPRFAPLVRAKRPSAELGLTDDDLDGGATLIDRKPPVVTEPEPHDGDGDAKFDREIDPEMQTMTAQLDQKDLAKLLGADVFDEPEKPGT